MCLLMSGYVVKYCVLKLFRCQNNGKKYKTTGFKGKMALLFLTKHKIGRVIIDIKISTTTHLIW